MALIKQEQIDFWNNKEFVFENFYSVDPESGNCEINLSKTKFNYVHYLKILIHLELEKNKISQPSFQDSEL